jgi:hypothetical protein
VDGRLILAKKNETINSKAREVGSTPQTYGFEEVGTVPKDYVPEGFESQEAFLADMRENYALDLEFDRENREEAAEDKLFAAPGNQWDPQVRAIREAEGLPCLEINTVPQFTAQLVGDWRQSRNSIKVVPAENGDTAVASIRSDLIRAIEHKSRAARVYDHAFESMVTCGDGAFQIAVEYAGEDVFDQEIVLKPIDDALSVVWDRMSIDPTGRDATRCYVDELYPRKEFKRLWPDSDPDELEKDVLNSCRSGGWVDADIVRVTAYWRIIVRDRLLVLFQNGCIHAIDDDTNIDDLMEKYGPPIRSRIAPCRYAQMHLVTGFEILAGPFEYKLNRLPIIRMTGRVMNVGGRRIRHGLVRPMKDVVRMKNFHRSVAAEQLGYAPKAKWIATETAVEGREEDFRQAHKKRDPLLVVNDGAVIGQDIQRLDPPKIEAALLNESNINTQDMKDVTGIHDASLGIKSNETSGRAIMARQREGDIASLTYYDNGNAAILEGGDVVNQLIGQIYDGTRIIRVIGEDEQAKMLKINDPMDPESPDLAVGAYDVAVTTGASYTTRRVEAAQAMMEAVQVFPQLMQVAGDLVAKAQDWPGAEELAERLRKTIPPQYLDDVDEHGQPVDKGNQVPPEIQQALMEGQQQLATLSEENKELKIKYDLELEKLKIDAFNAETQRMKVLADANAKNRQSREKAQENLERM